MCENRYAQRLIFTESLQNFQTLQVKLHLKNPFANSSLMGYIYGIARSLNCASQPVSCAACAALRKCKMVARLLKVRRRCFL